MAYLWVVPAQIGGSWIFRNRRGKDPFQVTFIQTYQQVRGIRNDGSLLGDARLNGAQVAFDLPRGSDPVRVTGRIEGSQILATLTRDGHSSDYVGTRR